MIQHFSLFIEFRKQISLPIQLFLEKSPSCLNSQMCFLASFIDLLSWPLCKNRKTYCRRVQRSPRHLLVSVSWAGGRARNVLRARLLVQHLLLRAQHPGGRDLPRQPAKHHRGRLHGPQPGRQVLSGSPLKH